MVPYGEAEGRRAFLVRPCGPRRPSCHREPAVQGAARRRLALAGVWLLLACSTSGRPPSPDPQREAETYAILLERVRGGDTDVDFRALRLARAESPEYAPYDQFVESNPAMWEALGRSPG